jgi:zinc/manganese transport system substrate-binding protein
MKLLVFTLFLLPTLTLAKIKVVTTTPDLAWLVSEIGKDKVEVFSLLKGNEDPHYVDAMPNWISKVSNADVFCFVGMELEIGWAPKVLSKSGNAKVQPGGKGHCNAGSSVKALEVPHGHVDRSMGDVHPGGNPHYHLGPTYFLQAADGIFAVLMEVDSSSTEYFLNNLTALTARVKAIKKKVATILKPKKGAKIISYHKEFSYFFKDFGLTGTGEIEETPGVPPSAGRIARVGLSAKRDKINLALGTTTNPEKLMKKFNEISGVPVAVIPLSIRKSGKPSNYEELLVNMAKTIVEKAK